MYWRSTLETLRGSTEGLQGLYLLWGFTLRVCSGHLPGGSTLEVYSGVLLGLSALGVYWGFTLLGQRILEHIPLGVYSGGVMGVCKSRLRILDLDMHIPILKENI